MYIRCVLFALLVFDCCKAEYGPLSSSEVNQFFNNEKKELSKEEYFPKWFRKFMIVKPLVTQGRHLEHGTDHEKNGRGGQLDYIFGGTGSQLGGRYNFDSTGPGSTGIGGLHTTYWDGTANAAAWHYGMTGSWSEIGPKAVDGSNVCTNREDCLKYSRDDTNSWGCGFSQCIRQPRLDDTSTCAMTSTCRGNFYCTDIDFWKNCVVPDSTNVHGTHGCTNIDVNKNLVTGGHCNTITCDSGYEASGELECTCGVMTKTTLKCIPKTEPNDQCGAYPTIPNGNVGTCEKGAKAGTTCTPTCNEGYSFDGIGMCQSDGSWAKFSCTLPEKATGKIFGKISTFTSTDCTGEPAAAPQTYQECRCRGDECQKITCKANGDYTTLSYKKAECTGDPTLKMIVKAGTAGDIIKFGKCQISSSETGSSK
jgi:hypothetical protein